MERFRIDTVAKEEAIHVAGIVDQVIHCMHSLPSQMPHQLQDFQFFFFPQSSNRGVALEGISLQRPYF
jgi:hypothetical protein